MMGEPGVDYPEEKMPVDVLADSRGDTLLSFVERVGDGELVVSVGEDRQRRPVRLEPGERLELVWRGPEELRAVPAELIAVETGERRAWRVRPVGPAGRGQRRAAVRAPMECRLSVTAGGQTLQGVTIDLSERGMRCLFADIAASRASDATAAEEQQAETDAATAARLTVGSVHEMTVWLDDGEHFTAQVEVTGRHPRQDRREEISVRFIGLPRKTEDLIRARVFARLRELRAQGLL